MILGHELAGTIDAVGPDVDSSRVGERAVALCFETCGRCPACTSGAHHLCADTQHLGHGAGFEGWDLNPGGYAEYCLVWAHRAVPLPGTVTFEDAVFADGLAVAVHAVRRAGLSAGAAILILGLGPIGHLCAQVATECAAGMVLCSEVNASARAHARRLLPHAAVSDPADTCLARLARRDAGVASVACVIDTTGSAEAQQAAVELLAPGGTMVFMAGVTEGVRLDLRALAGERAYTTSANFAFPEMDEAIRLLAMRDVEVEGLVTHRVPLSQVADALDLMDRKDETGAFKIVILPHA